MTFSYTHREKKWLTQYRNSSGNKIIIFDMEAAAFSKTFF